MASIISSGEVNMVQAQPMMGNDPALQDSGAVFVFNHQKQQLLQTASDNEQQVYESASQRKSGIKAALMSGLIPGTGQFYLKSYWRAAAYLVLETALWTGNIIYNNKGDDEDKRMKNFGELHWSEQRYWSNVYRKAKEEGVWSGSELQVDADNQILDADYTDVTIGRLRELENDPQLGYTHELPETRTQQYYEMIYKYLHQFGAGWDDVEATFGDAYFYDGLNNYVYLTGNIQTYRSMRNRSNDYYANADNMLKVILLNHLISALDAAWSAKQYNRHIALDVNRRNINHEQIYFYGLNLSW